MSLGVDDDDDHNINNSDTVNVCRNRTFGTRLDGADSNCTNNYLPLNGQLHVIRKASPPRSQNGDKNNAQGVTPFLVLMQGGRVGSTWLRELLDSHPNVSCEREIFNEHPCSGEKQRLRHEHQMKRCVVGVGGSIFEDDDAAVALCLLCCPALVFALLDLISVLDGCMVAFTNWFQIP